MHHRVRWHLDQMFFMSDVSHILLCNALSLRLGNRRALTISQEGRCLSPGPSSLHRDNFAKGNCYEQSHCEGCYESQSTIGERRHDPPRAWQFSSQKTKSLEPQSLDSCGKLVGVVSLTDIALSEAERAAIEHEQSGSSSGLNSWKKQFNREDLSGLHLEESGLLVRDIMTRSRLHHTRGSCGFRDRQDHGGRTSSPIAGHQGSPPGWHRDSIRSAEPSSSGRVNRSQRSSRFVTTIPGPGRLDPPSAVCHSRWGFLSHSCLVIRHSIRRFDQGSESFTQLKCQQPKDLNAPTFCAFGPLDVLEVFHVEADDIASFDELGAFEPRTPLLSVALFKVICPAAGELEEPFPPLLFR